MEIDLQELNSVDMGQMLVLTLLITLERKLKISWSAKS
jgi:hypothetical protein